MNYSKLIKIPQKSHSIPRKLFTFLILVSVLSFSCQDRDDDLLFYEPIDPIQILNAQPLEDYGNIYTSHEFQNSNFIHCQLKRLLDEDIGGVTSIYLNRFLKDPSARLLLHLGSEIYIPIKDETIYLDSKTLGMTIALGVGNDVIIILNPELEDSSKELALSIQVLLHEIIHAYFYVECWEEGMSYLDYLNRFVSCTNFLLETDNVSVPSGAEHHFLMHRHLRHKCSEALNTYFGHDDPTDFDCISWKGLGKSTGFWSKFWFQESLSEMCDRYIKIQPDLGDPCR